MRGVDIHAVQRNVRLIGSRPGDVAFLSGTGLQTEQIRQIAPLQRKLSNLVRIENVAEGGILRVNDDLVGACTHLNHLAHCPDSQLHVGLGLLAD